MINLPDQEQTGGNHLNAPPIFSRSGNKSEIAPQMWRRLGGDVKKFKDTFCGNSSILQARPLPADFERGGYVEQINDADGLVVNTLRAIRLTNPKILGEACERSYAEVDLIAAHREFVKKRGRLEYLLKSDVNYFDPDLAALFIWASRGWIGGGLGDPATVVNKKVPAASIAKFFGGSAENHIAWIQNRYRRVQILCGDGLAMVGSKTQLNAAGITAVVFDPPYSPARRARIYTHDDPQIARLARLKALELGELEKFRIAYCGFFSRYDKYFPANWERLRWKPTGGRYLQGQNPDGHRNANDECVWFSPYCLKP